MASVVVALLASAAPAAAATFTVTSGADTLTTGTLRQAISDAEANVNAPIVDQIQFDPSVTAVDLTGFLPTITEPLTITGPGAGSLDIRRGGSASGPFGFLVVQPSSASYTVTISGLTMSGAQSTGYSGGAIQMLAAGTLALDSVVLTGNTGSTAEALYYDHGLTTIVNSTLTNNTATSSDSNGGAIVGVGGEARIVNSTIDGNSAYAFGGGIFTGGDAKIQILSSTITHNTANGDNSGSGEGGGMYNSSSGQFAVANTLLAGNELGDGSDDQCSGSPFSSSGYNLRETSETGCAGFGAPGDFVNALPQIAATPATNGGPTPNVALLPGSPAINAGNPATLDGAYPDCPAKDQRGLFRGGAAGNCDIGSYEFNASSTPPAGGGTTTPPPSGGTTSGRAAAIAKCKKKFPKGKKRKKCIKRAKRRALA